MTPFRACIPFVVFVLLEGCSASTQNHPRIHQWYEHRTTHQRIRVEAMGPAARLYSDFNAKFQDYNRGVGSPLLSLVVSDIGSDRPCVLYQTGEKISGGIRFQDFAIRPVDDIVRDYVQLSLQSDHL